jgi:putative intracellular protease/amidase
MNIALVIYDGMTTLDFLGVFDALTRLKTMGIREDIEWRICGVASEVTDVAALRIFVQEVGRPLSELDLLVVPGGNSAGQMIRDTTLRGVTSSIDLRLYLVEKLAGREARETIRRQMDYEPMSW